MTTLRVLLRAPKEAARADAWALYDDAGALLQEGHDLPARWPQALRREAVLAAERARVVVLTLPPLAPARLASAVSYALEDQLASGDDPPRIALSAQQADGRVTAAIATRTLVAALEQDVPRWTRIVPEAALPAGDSWTWYASAAGGSFVRTPAGSFAASEVDDALPAELVAALAQAQRGKAVPDAVRVAFPCAADALARYAAQAGVPVVPAPPWQWTDTTAAAFAAAPDWRAVAAVDPARERGARKAAFRPAALLVGAALALHVTATLVQWAALHAGAWRNDAAIMALARQSGVTEADTPAAAVAGVTRHNADALHRAGRPAPGDALPLLAQAAPALAHLPAGALKSATYGDGAWTLELGRVDAATIEAIDRALAIQDVGVLQAPTSAGLRMRLVAKP